MRNLASIQKILNLRSIPNADQLELAQVLGWHVVVQKGEFNVGQGPREGIVIRPLVEIQDFDITVLNDFDLINGRVSFKAINPEFLLKYGE